ncbi:MAG: ABC transporter substrate-binding protein [Candidatus Hodarchaeota archaeon]
MTQIRFVILVGLMTVSLLVPVSRGLAATAQDSLVILHPHTSEFADHIINGFESWYLTKFGSSIVVSTIQKSSGDCYNDVVTWAGTPAADVWWGGGEYYFESARNEPVDLLYPYTVTEDVNITNYLGGWHLKDDSGDFSEPLWYAAALSGFGIIYNTSYLAAEGLSVPTSWDDLVNYSYFNHISMCDPDLSGSTVAIVKQLLQFKCDQHLSSEITEEANVTEGWQY